MRHRSLILIAILAVALVASACAGSLRDQVRKGALIAGESALAVDSAERNLYALGLPNYTAKDHAKAGAAILLMLEHVRSYERAARAWPEHVTMPATLAQAMADALTAIDTVQHVLEGVPEAVKVLDALSKVRAQIGGVS